MQDSFDKKYLLDEFEKVASDISKPLSIFIIGGGGLAFYGLKEATKDIDVVVQTPEELNVLKQTLMKLGYSTPEA